MALALGGIKFSAAKAELATVTHNGVCADDPRVLLRTNEATKILLSHLIPVGGMAIYDVVADGTILLLPPELDSATEVEVLNGAAVRGQTDVTTGWYDLVSNSTFVDPAMAHDNPLQDMFEEKDPDDFSILRRKYNYPGLQPGSTVRVTGPKRYVPITGDNDYLLIQNIPALKLEILARERLENNAIDEAAKYHQMAIEELQAEVRKYQMDPRNSLKRKAAYQSDLINYTEGTLGRTRARLALELQGFLLKGKAEISYLVNRAVQMLVDNRNQLAIAGRISVHGTTTELSYAPAVAAATILVWPDYNQIRLMVQSFITEGGDPNALQVAEEYQKKAFELQKAQLIEATEKARHTTYTSALATYTSGTFGWTIARLALEMPGGLAMTTTELERTLSMAEMRIIENAVFKGTLRSLTATITGGDILFPRDVESVIAADICGMPADIRSLLFEFQKNGPGYNYCGCQSMFSDRGEVWFGQTGSKRRKYHYSGSTTNSVTLNAIVKVRWYQKTACDELTVKNFSALQLMCQAIVSEHKEDWKNAGVAQMAALQILDKELTQHLGGIQHVPNFNTNEGYGFEGMGCPL